MLTYIRYVELTPSQQKPIQVQIHTCQKSCYAKHKGKCRYGFPIPPMKQTCILRPLNTECYSDEEINDSCALYQLIQNNLQSIRTKDNDKRTLEDFWKKLGVKEKDYLLAIQIHGIQKPTLFLRRAVGDTWINKYHPDILRA